MKQLRYAFWAIVVIFGIGSACLAQENASPCDQIERGLNSKASLWKVVRKSRSPCQSMSYFKLQSGKALVYIFIFPEKSVEQAGISFASLAADDEWCDRKADILGCGWRTSLEENRVWKCWRAEGVDLKKGRVVVRVSASTMKLSREFATYIGDALPDA